MMYNSTLNLYAPRLTGKQSYTIYILSEEKSASMFLFFPLARQNTSLLCGEQSDHTNSKELMIQVVYVIKKNMYSIAGTSAHSIDIEASVNHSTIPITYTPQLHEKASLWT